MGCLERSTDAAADAHAHAEARWNNHCVDTQASMPATFSQSLRALGADRPRHSFGAALIALPLVGGWLGWFFAAKVTVYEITETARIEASQASRGIDASVAGLVVTNHLVIGREVNVGDVLVELDADVERTKLAEAQTRLDSIGPQIEALRRQLIAEEQVIKDGRQSSVAAIQEGRAHRIEGDQAAVLAQEEAKRAATLFEHGAMTELEMLRSRTEADKRRAAASALAFGIDRIAGERRVHESEGKSRLEELTRHLETFKGQMTTTSAAIRVLERTIAARTILAPIAGRIGAVTELHPGAYVREGDRLGVVVPPGELHAIAEFPPSAALGRLRPGMEARLRLDGFPWATYGVVHAHVKNVAAEAHDGAIRVEFDLASDAAPRIPLQHGLPGSVEVDVEQATPVSLVLRAAGKKLRRDADPSVP